MGSGGGPQNSTSTNINRLPAYVTPFAKAYLSALGGMIFPGMEMPNNYFTKGWNFGQGTGGGTAAGASGGGGASTGQAVGAQPQVDPALMQAFGNPMIGGSPYLQQEQQKNPGAINSAMSPAAMNQLAQIYPFLMGGMG